MRLTLAERATKTNDTDNLQNLQSKATNKGAVHYVPRINKPGITNMLDVFFVPGEEVSSH